VAGKRLCATGGASPAKAHSCRGHSTAGSSRRSSRRLNRSTHGKGGGSGTSSSAGGSGAPGGAGGLLYRHQITPLEVLAAFAVGARDVSAPLDVDIPVEVLSEEALARRAASEGAWGASVASAAAGSAFLPIASVFSSEEQALYTSAALAARAAAQPGADLASVCAAAGAAGTGEAFTLATAHEALKRQALLAASAAAPPPLAAPAEPPGIAAPAPAPAPAVGNVRLPPPAAHRAIDPLSGFTTCRLSNGLTLSYMCRDHEPGSLRISCSARGGGSSEGPLGRIPALLSAPVGPVGGGGGHGGEGGGVTPVLGGLGLRYAPAAAL
jgi:hypothetical protein